jgi:hypothetical protein
VKRMRLTVIATAVLMGVFVAQAAAEVVYTQVNVSIPVGGAYNIDLNRDGVTNFTLRSSFLQDYCQFGDGYVWSLLVIPANGNAVVTSAGRIGSSNASALLMGAPVNSASSLYSNVATMAALYWGVCGTGVAGEWLNQPNRYLGFQFKGAANDVHYGWAKVSTVAYVDQRGILHASTVLTGFAYETNPGQAILTGQTSDGQN